MNEALQTKTHLQQELEVEREKVARQDLLIAEKLKNQSRTNEQLESEWLSEKNSLVEDVAKWKGLFQRLQKEANDKMQEFQDAELEKSEQLRQTLRASVKVEMEKRIAIAVDQALSDSAAEASLNIQKALTQARLQYQEEKEKSIKLLQDDFNVRLEHDVREATERTRKTLGMPASEVPSSNANYDDIISKKHDADNRNIELSYKNEQLETQLKETIAVSQRSLLSLKKSMERKSVENIHVLVKSLMNQAFKTLRVSFSEADSYEPETILDVIREVLIGGTLNSLPAIPEEEEEEEDNDAAALLLQQHTPSPSSITHSSTPLVLKQVVETPESTSYTTTRQSVSVDPTADGNEDDERENERIKEEEKEKAAINEARKLKEMLQEKQRHEELARLEEEENRKAKEEAEKLKNQSTSSTTKKVWEDDLEDESFFADSYDDGLGISRPKSTASSTTSTTSEGAKKEEKKSIFDNDDDDDDDLWG